MNKIIAGCLMTVVIGLSPCRARADFFGGDIPLLIQVVANTAQQLAQLRAILGTSVDTLRYIEDINRGLREAMRLARTQNATLAPGVLSQLQNVEQIMGAVERLYGRVPNTAEAPMQRTIDQTVAEAIQMHNQAFKYADAIDPEAERIKEYARLASPQGAERLTAQSLGVLVHVMNQVLRTNAAILKLQSEQLALGNRREKVQSEHFKMQYEGLARAFDELQPSYDLPSLSGR
ncbi:MAG TPA: hypothetical protein VJB59_02985 [Bdellovibrionota bacterium]|nr:hypothetical protein [Bdellovibrionota bacterium]